MNCRWHENCNYGSQEEKGYLALVGTDIMSEKKDEKMSRPRRMRWFVFGIVAGMFLFPWVAGLPYAASWQNVKSRTTTVGNRACQVAGSKLRDGWDFLNRAVLSSEQGSE